MNLRAELDGLTLDPALTESIAQLVQRHVAAAQEQVIQHKTELHAAQTKIQALVLELAHLKRMRFGVKSESLDAESRDLFQETLASDVAAAEIELAKRQEAAEDGATPAELPRRERAGRQPLPEHLPGIEHRHEPASCACLASRSP